jgi:hypothetical protein
MQAAKGAHALLAWQADAWVQHLSAAHDAHGEVPNSTPQAWVDWALS